MAIINSKEKSKNLLLKIFKALPKSEKLKIFYIILTVSFSSSFDFISIKAISPLVTNLSNNNISEDNFITKLIFYFYQNNNENFILISIAIVFVVSLLFSTIFKLLNLYLTSSFTASSTVYFNKKIFEYIFSQPFSFFINKNSSEFLALTTKYIDSGVDTLKSLIIFSTSIFMASVIAFTLLVSNFSVTFNIILFIVIMYLIFTIVVYSKLKINGKIVDNESRNNIKLVQESIGSIREIILNKSQNYFIRQLISSTKKIKFAVLKLDVFLSFPRYMIEAVGVTSIVVFGIFFNPSQNISNTLPYIASVSFGLQKLLPIFQSIYSAWSVIKSRKYSLNYLVEYIDINIQSQFIAERDANPRINFTKSLKFENISFNYENTNKNALENINFEIKKGESIGIIGSTGSGKSTLIDIIMGLLKPSGGTFFVDGYDIYSNKEDVLYWQSNISHVPQDIFLADSKILENIALGIDESKIDFKDLHKAADKAQLKKFIDEQDNGYQSIIGERGIKISGGQKQRLGIARALYRKSNILILDEATSALDYLTEKNIMNSIQNKQNELTLIIVAHRQSTLKNCDRVMELKDGKIISFGKPSQILNEK